MAEKAAELQAERDFDRWLEAIESDGPIPPALPSTIMRRRLVVWDGHWENRAARARRKPVNRPFPKEAFLEIPATEYVPVLADQDVDPGRAIPCPLPGHEERTASFYAYPDGRGWYCFGCGEGGDIFALAGQIWGVDPNSSGFDEICRRLGGLFA